MKRSKVIIRIVATMVAVLFFLTVFAPLVMVRVGAVPTDAKLKEYEEKEKTAWQQMQELEKELNELGEERFQLEEQQKAGQEELEQTTERLEVARRLEAEQREKFKSRFAMMSERGGIGNYLETIFSARSFSDLLEKLVIVREIVEYDNSVLTAMEELKEEIGAEQIRLEELQESRQKTLDSLLQKEEELYAKSAEIAAYRQSLEEDKNAYIKYLEQKAAEEAATKARAGIVAGVGEADLSLVSESGLLWPTNTDRITSAFSGGRVNPVTGVLRPHTGTDIGAFHGAPVWASQSGKVVLAEYNGGYGNCVILDHGNGVKTLYGHMSAILVRQGDTVAQGNQIGRVGSTGNSTGPHLHFEVLIHGVAVDPMQFF